MIVIDLQLYQLESLSHVQPANRVLVVDAIVVTSLPVYINNTIYAVHNGPCLQHDGISYGSELHQKLRIVAFEDRFAKHYRIYRYPSRV